MKNKIDFYVQEFKKAPLPMQNVIIKKSIYCIAYVIGAAVMLRAAASLNILIPGIIIFGYLLFDFFRACHVCCHEKYSYVSGECIQIHEKNPLHGLSREKGKISAIRIRYDVSRDITIKIRSQKDIVDIEEGKMIDIYIPDYARVYQDGMGLRIDEYYCLQVR